MESGWRAQPAHNSTWAGFDSFIPNTLPRGVFIVRATPNPRIVIQETRGCNCPCTSGLSLNKHVFSHVWVRLYETPMDAPLTPAHVTFISNMRTRQHVITCDIRLLIATHNGIILQSGLPVPPLYTTCRSHKCPRNSKGFVTHGVVGGNWSSALIHTHTCMHAHTYTRTHTYRTVSCIRCTFLPQNLTSKEGVRLIHEYI